MQKEGGILQKEEKDVLCKEEKEELASNRSCCSMKEETEKQQIERKKQPEERTRESGQGEQTRENKKFAATQCHLLTLAWYCERTCVMPESTSVFHFSGHVSRGKSVDERMALFRRSSIVEIPQVSWFFYVNRSFKSRGCNESLYT